MVRFVTLSGAKGAIPPSLQADIPAHRPTALPPYRLTVYPHDHPSAPCRADPPGRRRGGEAAPARPHEAPGDGPARRHERRVPGDPHPGAAASLAWLRSRDGGGGDGRWPRRLVRDHGAVPPSAQHPDPPHRHHPQPQGPNRAHPRQLRPAQLSLPRGPRAPAPRAPAEPAARPSGSGGRSTRARSRLTRRPRFGAPPTWYATRTCTASSSAA